VSRVTRYAVRGVAANHKTQKQLKVGRTSYYISYLLCQNLILPIALLPIVATLIFFKKGMDNHLSNEDEEPPTLEDSDNEGGIGVAGAPRSFYASLRDPILQQGGRTVAVSHQAQLRQQAHAPVGGIASEEDSNAATSGRYSYLPRLENLTINAPGLGDSHGTHSFSIPEYGVTDSPTSLSNTSGWSIVETKGGMPPSARSLHAAALLNGVMYVFGGYDGECLGR
jgi:hypothetical protein